LAVYRDISAMGSDVMVIKVLIIRK